MSKRINMVGKKYGKLTVLEMIYDEKRKQFSRCKCLCDCGNIVIKDAYRLRNWCQEPSCGCNIKDIMRKRFSKNIDGKRFGRLIVLESIWDEFDKPKVKCQCDCGNIVIINRNDVICNHTLSCGCLQKEAASKARQQDDTGYISDFNVKIIKPYKKNDKRQLLWECECGLCGTHFYELPARIKNNHVRSCGCLVSSSMETFISDFLKENNIEFLTQYTYDDCLNKKGNKLRFDFAIIKNGEVFCLLEYDGKQHFEPIKYYGGNKCFEIRQEYDRVKNEYCKNHNIPLFRFPYYLSNDEIQEKIMNIMNP